MWFNFCAPRRELQAALLLLFVVIFLTRQNDELQKWKDIFFQQLVELSPTDNTFQPFTIYIRKTSSTAAALHHRLLSIISSIKNEW